MQRLICQGRLPFWAVRDGCLQGFSAVGLLRESETDLGGQWAVSLWWHWTDILVCEDYFKADHRDGLVAQFLSCSLWCAPPTCFLCILRNSGLYIQTFHTSSRPIQPVFLLLNMVKIPLIISFLKWFHYTDHSNWLLQYHLLLKACFWGISKRSLCWSSRSSFIFCLYLKF